MIHDNWYIISVVGADVNKNMPVHEQSPWTGYFLAGLAGFEPTDNGVKVRCLTAWLQPNIRHGTGCPNPVPLFVGWKMGFEPTISSATDWRFNRLSYIHHMVRQKGLEPLTYCLEGSCSIQLSYWREWCQWSEWWESNPHDQLGRLEFYHWTTLAF